MNCLLRKSTARFRWMVVCLAVVLGCGPYQSAPVKVDVAKQTLLSTMDCWKDGGVPDDMRKETPPVVVGDLDWSAGKKLVSYELVGDDKPVDANLYAKVKLKLSDGEGKSTEKTVTYCVGTNPALTVIRDLTR